MKNILTRTLLLSTAASASIASPVLAQSAEDVAAQSSEVVEAEADAQSEPADSGAGIVVTGSRVISNGDNSPTPVTVLNTETLARTTPSNVADALNKLPVFSNSNTQRTTGNASANFVANYLNLRGIGPLRTLILFDGHRVPSTGGAGEVDVNTIPQFLLERVDVVTGGASAVYGSDAVTGVVNFVVDRDFNGVKGLAQAGISNYGDGGSQRFAIAAGSPLGERAHLEASYEFYNLDSIDSKLARPLGQMVYGEQGLGTAAVPFRLVPNVRYGNFSAGGYIRNGPQANQQFGPGGVIVPFIQGTPTGTANIVSGGSGTFIRGGLTASLRSHQGFARFDYELTDAVRFRLQGSATQSENDYIFAQASFNAFTFATNNAFLPAATQAALSATGASTFQVGKRVDSRLYQLEAETQNYFGTVGLEGEFGSDFKWDIGYTRAQTTQHVELPRNVNTARFAAASDAVRDASGQIVCRVTVTNPGLYPGCVPLNVFGPGSESDEAWAYVTNPTFFDLRNRMDDILASLSGSPFSTWAGPVKMAVTGEHRRVSFRNVSNAEPTARPDCTALRFNCLPTSLLYFTNIVASARGKQHVTEGSFEVDVPLVTDVPFIESFNVNGAVRLTDYSTSGRATTWKVGVDWHVTDDLRFRSTRSRDIRAPSLNDLFAPLNVSPSGYTDLHTGIAMAVQIASQGNSSLKPEIANTFTAGIVYKPSWAPGLSAAIDYYNIKIDDAITSVTGTDITVQRLCENSGGTSPVCSLFIRPLPFSDRSAANFPTRVLVQALNVAKLEQSGIDAELNYRAPVGPGSLSVRALVSHVWQQDTQQFADAPLIRWAGVAGYPPSAGGLGVPKWKLTGFLQYQTNFMTVDVQQRWRSSLKQSGDASLVYLDPKVPSVGFTDLSITFNIDEARNQNFFLSVENLFNTQSPPFLPTNFASTPNFYYPVAGGDDVIGRYFTAGVRMRF